MSYKPLGVPNRVLLDLHHRLQQPVDEAGTATTAAITSIVTSVQCKETGRIWFKTPGGGLWSGHRQGEMFHSVDSIAGTLTCAHAVKLWDLQRLLTPRETARLQGFPDSFVLPAVRYNKLFGNAIAVPCARFACSRVISDDDAALRHVDLCAGIGGFSVAMHAAHPNVECVGFSEIYDTAAESYLANFPGTPALGDACAVAEWPKCDVLTAGFPCQPFSRALSNFPSAEHDKLGFFRTVIHAIESSEATRIVLENVSTLLSIGREQFKDLLAELERLGFVVEYKVLNAADFGVPQTRKRLYIVGRRDGIAPRPLGAFEPVERPTLRDILESTEPLALPALAPPYAEPHGKVRKSSVWDESKGTWERRVT